MSRKGSGSESESGGRGPSGHEQRSAPRHPLYVPVAIESDGTCDEGRLCDVSVGGGRIERARFKPAIGATVTITFAFSLNESAFQVQGRVVRHTQEDGGFAVVFEAVDPALKEAVERAAVALRALPDSR
jgi:hypothetical protein